MEIQSSVPIQSHATPSKVPYRLSQEAADAATGEARVDPQHEAAPGIEAETAGLEQLDEKFSEFVGKTLFGSMLASMRKTVGKPAYMHGGRTEEVFQQQLDGILVEELTEASADEIAKPMFELFQLQRRA